MQSQRLTSLRADFSACLRDLAVGTSALHYSEVTGLLMRLINNVVLHPEDGRFRRIDLDFPLVQRLLGTQI